MVYCCLYCGYYRRLMPHTFDVEAELLTAECSCTNRTLIDYSEVKEIVRTPDPQILMNLRGTVLVNKTIPGFPVLGAVEDVYLTVNFKISPKRYYYTFFIFYQLDDVLL